MKRQIANLIGVFAMLLATGANAQTLQVKANVPFDFVVEKATMPAGDYSIEALSSSSKALTIRNRDAGIQKLTLSNSASSVDFSQETRLVFHRYGDVYFLSQIWVQGANEGRELRMTRREIELAKNATPELVVLAALQ